MVGQTLEPLAVRMCASLFDGTAPSRADHRTGARDPLQNLPVFLDINGIRLNVVSFGSGERIIVGTGGWAGSWELWQQPFELLTADGWRCIAYDHRGSGESSVDPELITVDAMADDAVGVLDALGIETCILAGESMGGVVAQHAAVRHPHRFTGLVLVDAPRPGSGTSEGRAAFAAATRSDYPAVVGPFADACIPEPNSEHVRRWARNILLRSEPEQAARLTEMWEDAPLIDPGEITMRTLLVHGADDAIVSVSESRALVELLPDAELVVLDGTGHVPTMTRPHDVADAINRRFPAAS
jgi:pimeloyl-ACP methyl ester carboxylesterase